MRHQIQHRKAFFDLVSPDHQQLADVETENPGRYCCCVWHHKSQCVFFIVIPSLLLFIVIVIHREQELCQLLIFLYYQQVTEIKKEGSREWGGRVLPNCCY